VISNFFLGNVVIFLGKFTKSSLDRVAWDCFYLFIAKWRIFTTNFFKKSLEETSFVELFLGLK
jgi:hypothetical protein